MENPQMGMPAEMAPQGPGPDQMAIFEQMRQEISPQEFSNEMLASASQVDPQAVAEFTQELQGLDMPPEVLDALNDVVDEILANPERYDELRAQYMGQGLPEDILPEEFDPNFFAALNMAIDQMIAAPAGVQAFAKGGIAELKPIAKAIASYGRNGDTMLAHITPAEARMLRRRGGSGTTNPSTGLPEFFNLFKSIGKAFKSIGRAVKKFVNSTVGRIITTVALGFFLGPAAAGMLGVTSTAGVAAVSGFLGSAGSTLLGGGNLKDALKAGAIGGLTAGAGAGIMGGADAFASGSASTAGMTAGQAVSNQWDKFTNVFSPGAPVVNTPTLSPTPVEGGAVQGIGPNQAAVPQPTAPAVGTDYPQALADTPARGSFPAKDALTDNYTTSAQRDAYISQQGLDKPPSLVDQTKDFYNKNISPTGIKEAATPAAQEAGIKAVTGYKAQMAAAGITPTDTALTNVYNKAFNAAMPGILGTYGPMAAVGLGTMGVLGGFNSKPVEGGDITKSLMKPVTQRIAEEGTQRQMYLQGLPGVKYDQYGAPIFGESERFPTYGLPDYSSAGYGQGIMDLPSVYIPPPGTIGSRRVEQPYNNSDMYGNLVPRRAADGGYIQHFDNGGDASELSVPGLPGMIKKLTDGVIDKANIKTPEEIAKDAAAAQALKDSQLANRTRVAQEKAMRKAQGSGQMYANINAGLAARAPENFPGTPVKLDAAREAAMRADFTGANKDIDYARVMQEKGYRPEEVASLTNRSFGDINRRYNTALRQDAYAPMLEGQRNAMAEQARTLGGIAGLAAGGYPRRTGQISGPGTEKSDSIPAMLSDGEFVMTAKAVRGAGKGSRRAGAKQMYKLMHQLEKNSERG